MIILLIPSVLNHYKAPKEGPERAALAKAELEGAIGREARCALITGSGFLWPTHVKFQFSSLSPHFAPPPPLPGLPKAAGAPRAGRAGGEGAPGRGGEPNAVLCSWKLGGRRGGGGGREGGSFLGFYFFFLCIVKFGGSSHGSPPTPNPEGFLAWQRAFRVLTVDFYNRVSLKMKFMSNYAVKGIDLDSGL